MKKVRDTDLCLFTITLHFTSHSIFLSPPPLSNAVSFSLSPLSYVEQRASLQTVHGFNKIMDLESGFEGLFASVPALRFSNGSVALMRYVKHIA